MRADRWGFVFRRCHRADTKSLHTERGTVVADDFHTTAVLRTLRKRFDLGPALTKRDAAAPSLEIAFNRSEPRRDRPEVIPPPYVEPPPLTPEQEKEAFGDAPDAGLLLAKRKQAAAEHVSQIGEATLRNAARLLEHEGELPASASAAREWLGSHAGRLFAAK